MAMKKTHDPATGVFISHKRLDRLLTGLMTKQYPLLEFADTTDVERALPHIFEAFDVYPSEFVRSLIFMVELRKRVGIKGREVGGYAPWKGICISGIGREAEGVWLAHMVHHELAHHVSKKGFRKRVRKEWLELNGDAEYIGYDEYFRRSEAGLLPSEEDVADLGFLESYGMASIEEDFATIAAAIMTWGPEFWQEAKHYKTLRNKAFIVLRVYELVDKRMTLEWFGFEIVKNDEVVGTGEA